MKKYAKATPTDIKLSRFHITRGRNQRISPVARALGVGLILCLAGCTTTTPAQQSAQPAPKVTAAFFADDPAALVAAAKAACGAPGEEFVRPRAGVTQCRLLLDPPTTAAVILGYDGNINALPQLVISLTTARAGKGYLVTGCAFLKVPRKDGRVSRIVQNDSKVAAQLRELLDAVGGKPVRDVPDGAAERCYSL